MGGSLEFLEGAELKRALNFEVGATEFEAKNLTIVVSCSPIKPRNWQVLVLGGELGLKEL
jgi:hypothetical protein